MFQRTACILAPPCRLAHGQLALIAFLAVAGCPLAAQDRGVQGVTATPSDEIAQADEAGLPGLAIYGGLALTSNYVSDGVTQTEDGPALQGYLELEASGFYAGFWSSNVEFEGVDDSVELDLYLGYRGETPGGLAYDLGYYRYYYNDTGDCCGEAIAVLSGQATDRLALEGQLTYDPEFDDYSVEVSPEFAITDAWSASGTLGYKHSLDGAYGDLGVTYSLNDTASLDFRYADAEGQGNDGIFFVTLSLDATLLGK